ncbi:glutamate 5-kinase [Mesorhizobium sp.]|uniref:glutamate 5-kinase n=1 Tax=Mesorhizobium sp. TaxID=1871066 RepID=UPI00257D867E|nr:glutamate 5-kinase [Mesorhizobium sp.]
MLLARRLIVKIGSALLVDADTGEICGPWLDSLVADVVRFFSRGQQVIIVTSGAVALGSRQFDGLGRPLRIDEKQTAAAIGQVRLMLAYEQSLRAHGLAAGQMLLTNEDIYNHQRRRNTWSTLQQLHNVGAVPIINENDTIATAEICFGDNDQLAARIAQMVNADVLVLLSNVDGLFTDDPHHNPLARLVTEVRCITPEIEAMAGHSHARYSSGGMVTKLMAAKTTMDAGCGMIIARGNEPYPLAAIENGAPSTSFFPLVKRRGASDT